MRFLIGRLLVIGAAATFAACGLVLGPDETTMLGTIEYYGESIRIELPDTVEAGESFTAAVVTYGGGCHSRGQTIVEVRNLRATISPYDIEVEANACTRQLKHFEHTATVTFTQAGVATLIFRGRTQPENATIAVERSVVVR